MKNTLIQLRDDLLHLSTRHQSLSNRELREKSQHIAEKRRERLLSIIDIYEVKRCTCFDCGVFYVDSHTNEEIELSLFSSDGLDGGNTTYQCVKCGKEGFISVDNIVGTPKVAKSKQEQRELESLLQIFHRLKYLPYHAQKFTDRAQFHVSILVLLRKVEHTLIPFDFESFISDIKEVKND